MTTDFPQMPDMTNWHKPTDEELQAELIIRTNEDVNCISRWYPLLLEAGLRMPETKIITIDPKSYFALAGGDPGLDKTLIDRVYQAYKEFDGAAFMKLGNFSGKHNWEDTCFLNTGLIRQDTERHLREIAFMQCCFGCMESLAVAVRRFISTRPAFIAHEFGHMPVTRERRFFTNADNQVVCHHPYWPKHAFQHELTPEEAKSLEQVSIIDASDLIILTLEARKAAIALEPLYNQGWSIDFLQDADGSWWLIDVAVASQSYHWEHKDGQNYN